MILSLIQVWVILSKNISLSMVWDCGCCKTRSEDIFWSDHTIPKSFLIASISIVLSSSIICTTWFILSKNIWCWSGSICKYDNLDAMSNSSWVIIIKRADKSLHTIWSHYVMSVLLKDLTRTHLLSACLFWKPVIDIVLWSIVTKPKNTY